jgi:hypothetical protein
MTSLTEGNCYSTHCNKTNLCTIKTDYMKMHSEIIRIMDAERANLLNNFKNTKGKLLKTNAAIWFNKMCKIRQVKPNYVNTIIKGRKQQDKKTASQAIRYRITQEIKFLYRKKQHLNEQLYRIHLKCAHLYNSMWQYIQEIIHYRNTATNRWRDRHSTNNN